MGNVNLTDTHTHLYLPEFEPSPAEAVRRALDAGVSRMIFPNVDLSTIAPMKKLHEEFPSQTYMAMGLHPTEINADWEEMLESTDSELKTNISEYIAVGEIGMDLYWDKTYRDQQMKAFDRQVTLAESLNLPVIIHCREALDETIEVLEGHKGVKAVFHSFGGTERDVDRIRGHINDNLFFGINGIVTFKNSKLRNTLPAITLSRLLLETDSPYLAPVPHRGKRNESAFLIHTAGHIADQLGSNLQTVSEVTSINASEFFNI